MGFSRQEHWSGVPLQPNTFPRVPCVPLRQVARRGPEFFLCLRGQSTLLWTLIFQTSSILWLMCIPNGERWKQKCPLSQFQERKGKCHQKSRLPGQVGRPPHPRKGCHPHRGTHKTLFPTAPLPHLPHPGLEFKSQQWESQLLQNLVHPNSGSHFYSNSFVHHIQEETINSKAPISELFQPRALDGHLQQRAESATGKEPAPSGLPPSRAPRRPSPGRAHWAQLGNRLPSSLEDAGC